MTIFGKVLIFLNLLMATVFVYAAALDYGKRATWSYAVYRDDLTIDGLPVDENEREPIGNDLRVDHLSDETMKSLFAAVGGNPVRTQTDEVARVRDELRAVLDALPDDSGKRAKLKEMLLPLARTTGDRYAVAERIDDRNPDGTPKAQAVPWDELLNDFNAIFEEVTRLEVRDEGVVANDANRRPIVVQLLPRDKRQAIAHLLFNIKPADEAHARLQVVIGLKAFNEEAKVQTDNLEVIVDSVKFAMLGDRSGFEFEYLKMLGEIRDRVESLADRQLYLENQEKLKMEHTTLRDGRQKDVDETKAELFKRKTQMRDNLKLQAKEEDSLFESQLILSQVAADNERKEREIRKLERIYPQTGK